MALANRTISSPLAQRLLAYVNLHKRENFWEQLRGDFFGGTVAALIAVPYGMALAVAMGMRPEAGLYTSILGGFIAGMLSSSPVLISGLSATAAPIIGAITHQYGIGASLLTGLLCGLAMTLIGMLRLGRFANYLPQSIVAAFTSGLGVTIFTSQLKSLLAVQSYKPSFDLGVVDDFIAVVVMLPTSHPQALIVGGIVIFTMILLPKWNEQIPASIIGVLLANLRSVCIWL